MSTSTSSFGALESSGSRKRVQFDPTINLGHILTFVGFMLAGFGAWGNIDKRLTLTEVQSVAVVERTADQDKRMNEALRELKADVKDVQRAVNDINRTLASEKK